MRAVIGLRDEDLAPFEVDLSDGHFLVIGPYRSGRSNALAAIASRVSGAELHLLAPRRTSLNALTVWTSVIQGVEDCEREAQELAQSDLREGLRKIFVVDDADEFVDGVADAFLERVVRLGRESDTRLIAACETHAAHRAYSGFLRELRKEEHGLVLSPQAEIDGDLFGVRLPRSARAATVGRGFAVGRGMTELVQVADARV